MSAMLYHGCDIETWPAANIAEFVCGSLASCRYHEAAQATLNHHHNDQEPCGSTNRLFQVQDYFKSFVKHAGSISNRNAGSHRR